MDIKPKLAMSIRCHLIFPYFALRDFMAGYRNTKNISGTDDDYLIAVISWLVRATKVKNNQGVSHSYAFLRGWRGSYPETVGYIIPTLFDYYKISGKILYYNLAKRLTDWLISVQMENGATVGGIVNGNPVPIVFNTGQNILGFVRTYRETKDEKYIDAANRAGSFLVSSINGDTWVDDAYNNIPHSYNTRTSWALLELWKENKNSSFLHTAKSHLDWVCINTHDNGFFKYCKFEERQESNTHVIAYTIRGLLESYNILNNGKYFSLSKKVSTKFADLILEKGTLVSDWDSTYTPKSSHVCLTGLAQFSIIWLKLYKITNQVKFLDATNKALRFVKSTVTLNRGLKDVYGAVPGSFPIYGSYAPLQYPNWASKFFADSLMIKNHIFHNNTLMRENSVYE